jgi:hypothetical protein
MSVKLLVPCAGVLVAALAVLHAQGELLQRLDTPAGPGSGMYALSPQVLPFREGRYSEPEPVLSWIDPLAEGGHALRFATLDGDRWSPAREVARGTNWFANWADHPSVVRLGDASGTLLAHWLVRSGDGTSKYGYGLRIARSTDDGRHWTPLYQVAPADTQDYAGFVAFSTVQPVPGAAYLAPTPGTSGHVPAPTSPAVGHPEPQKALLYAHFRVEGRTAIDVLDPDTCSCCTVATAWTAQGRIVVYRDHKAGDVRDISIVRWAGPGWSQPTTIHEDGWVIPGCPTNGPAVSADGNRVAVAWFTAPAGAPRVTVAFSADSGASFGPPVPVDAGSPIGWAGVVLTDEGDAIVSWLEGTPGGGGQVRVRRVRDGVGAGPALVVADTRAGRSTGIPQLSRSRNRLVVAWRDDRVRTALIPLDMVERPAPIQRHR